MLHIPSISPAFVYRCYYDTSLICKETFSIVFNTYTTLSHTTFRKLLLSCVFKAMEKVFLPPSHVLQVHPLSRNCMVQPINVCTQVQILSSPLHNLIFILLFFTSRYKYSPLQLRFTTRHIGKREEGNFPYIKKLQKKFT
jgi:hypothetical protein